jgi:TolA-binding protein
VSRQAGALALVLAAASLSGCIATQQDVLELSQQSDDLKAQVVDLKKTISSMQANQADLSVQIKTLQEDLTAYSETVKASMGNMDQLSSKIDQMDSQLSGKVTQLGVVLSAEEQKGREAQQKGLEAQQKALEAQKAELEAQGRETAATELLLTSEKRLQSHDYALASSGLEDYLKKFPGGALTDVATYDLGLSYFGLKQWEKAGVQFAVVLDKYPKSGQTPGARLNYALCLISLGKKGDEARTYLESIVADFPKSSEAKDAELELKRLAKAAKSAKAAKAKSVKE